jgi:RimJ/RimL family protein N-acetyltransferase
VISLPTFVCLVQGLSLHFSSVTTVETPRLLLRLPQPADAHRFLEMHQDPEVIERKQVTLTEPVGGIDLALRNIDRMLRHWQVRGYGQWAVVEKTTNDVMGCVGFFHPDPWPGIDLGWIIHRSRWNMGFGSEAARAAIQWAWDSTEIDHIISLIAPDDLRSIRIATKIGEQFERADVDPINGETVHVYGIDRARRIDL